MGIGKRDFILGFLACLVLFGCSSFAYKYYGLDGVRYDDGKLLADKPENDIPFSNCAPTDTEKHRCVVMFTPEFKAMKLDYEDTKMRLIECEKGRSIQ